MSIERTIWVKFQKEGIHRYPEALTAPELKEVEFLGHPHRHMFHFRVEVPVNHDNRDIEFILLKRYCESLYDEGTLQLDYQSCEMMAYSLGKDVMNTYGVEWVKVDVSEDDENGSSVTIDRRFQS